MRSARFASLCIAAACVCAGPALADGHMEKAVKARKGFMQVVAFNLGPLGAMAKGEMEYDAEAAAAYAANLEVLAKMNTGAMWPAGSDNAALGEDKTRALPAAWASDSKVMEKHGAWTEASVNLAAVAGDGLDALKGAIGDVGKSCGGCHDDYRAEKK
ncbi:MAG: cytochrome c [Pseudomonadota bacterium]